MEGFYAAFTRFTDNRMEAYRPKLLDRPASSTAHPGHMFRFLLILSLLAALPAVAQEGGAEEGKASWYGGQHVGRKTASGEIFTRHLLTAAHKTLPLGTLVRVTNLANHRSIVVKINDRGPYITGRVIDLSERAARDLAMYDSGVAEVSLERISLP